MAAPRPPVSPRGQSGPRNRPHLDLGDEKLGTWVVRARNGLFIREKPTTKSHDVGVLEFKEEVEILESRDGWVRHNRGWSLMQNENNKIPLMTRVPTLEGVVIDNCEQYCIEFVHLKENRVGDGADGRAQWTCAQCFKRFSSERLLKRHMAFHEDAKTPNSNNSAKSWLSSGVQSPGELRGAGDASPRGSTYWITASLDDDELLRDMGY